MWNLFGRGRARSTGGQVALGLVMERNGVTVLLRCARNISRCERQPCVTKDGAPDVDPGSPRRIAPRDDSGLRSHHSSATALVRIGTIAAFFAVCASVSAQPYPSKPVRWISPHAAGGGADLTTRLVAQRLSDLIGHPVVVDNRIGASGNIGAELAARAPADGYTLVTITASHPANHAIAERVSYDLTRDLAYVTQMTTQPYILVVHPSIAAKSVKELIAVARAAPRTLHYGSSGIGTLQHLAGVMFGAMSGTELVHVPYKGGALALTDMIGGRLQLFFGVILSSMPHIKSGKIRAIAVTSSRRAPIFPEVPTIAESGLKGYVVDNWYGVAAPARTPRVVITKLHSELVRALKSPEVEDRLRKDGSEPVGNSPEEFAAIVRDDLQRWRKHVKEAGIKPES